MDRNEADNPADPLGTGRSSYRDHTLNRRSAMRDEEDLVERVERVLVCMGGLGLNLPVFLHALSWGNEPLISKNTAKYHRSVLMNSLKLPEILKQWSKKSEAARRSLTQWATDHVTQLINNEMNVVVEKFRWDREDLSEGTFLSITPRSMTLLLKPEVPTLRRILKSASRTGQQEKRKKGDSKKVYAFIQSENRTLITYMKERVVRRPSARFFEKP